MRPFKPPSLVKSSPLCELPVDGAYHGNPPSKRRRTNDSENHTTIPNTKNESSATGLRKLGLRQPLHNVSNATTSARPLVVNVEAVYYNVLWRKPSNKKHKTWDGDGFLKVIGDYAFLRDRETGKDMGRVACSGPLQPESSLLIGGKDVEVESCASRDESISANSFLPSKSSEASTHMLDHSKARPLVTKAPVSTWNEGLVGRLNPVLNQATPTNYATQARFKNPMLHANLLNHVNGDTPTPRHDPSAPDALIMKRPTSVPANKRIVDVVVDPLISRHLREHQRDGVKFLYECVMDLRDYSGQGAILADEMGLGKTLQTIALLWTLLKQNPVHGEEPVIKKAVIVCLVTLINNWKKEFRKWLGMERIGVFIADASKNRITDFTKGRSYSVMIIGYEKVRKLADDLQKGHGVDIIVADEGHRLKTAQNKSAAAMRSLDTPRRIILSGTPIQNDLSEFFSMVDFVNPGVLGNLKRFTKDFEDPILKSQQPEASEGIIQRGQARSKELGESTAPFILRRTAEILSKYLPTKVEFVLMCKATSAQVAVYRQVLASSVFQSAIGRSENTLQLITILRKLCNSPKLLQIDAKQDVERGLLSSQLMSSISPGLLRNNSASTKLRVLDHLLHAIRTQTTEKVVLVSNFTSTLDLISTLLSSLSLPFLRLDGSTPVNKRQELVDSFNRTSSSTMFAFLLSAKAGGMGINLIGASRLVLFDVDWNPATDAQSMARIHRDGQKRPCFIYRLLMAGGLDEKIWQRQVTKIGLAHSIMEQKAGMSSFTQDELKDLLRLDERDVCQTHELLECSCRGRGIQGTATTPDLDTSNDGDVGSSPPVNELVACSRPKFDHSSQVETLIEKHKLAQENMAGRSDVGGISLQGLMTYTHIDTSRFSKGTERTSKALIQDDILSAILQDEENKVNFVFARTSGG